MTTRTPATHSTGLRIPDHLPVVAFLLTTVLVSAYLLAPVIAETTLGRPSSTSGIGFFIGPLVAILCGGAVLVVGICLRWLARSAGVSAMVVPGWLIGCVLLATLGVVVSLGVHARTQVMTQEFARRPRVIIESARVMKVPVPGSAVARIEAPLLYSIYAGETVAPGIVWNGRAVSVDGVNEQVAVLDAARTRMASTDLHDFDYIGRVNAVPFCQLQDGAHGIAVLVTLRATSNRSMFLLYGTDGAVLYQEHLERTRGSGAWGGAMSVVKSGRNEVLVVDHGAVDAYTCSTG